MFERFRRTHEDPRDPAPADGSGSVAVAAREREADDAALRDREEGARFHRDEAATAVAPATARPASAGAATTSPARRALAAEELRDLRARQRARFGC
ncbi:MAG TPA: hypothetical protein VGP78_03205, partial [Solirubrobacteraceae bacterium]|nr:hypothetical protein [Solirubrobacteraceae bacterium]